VGLCPGLAISLVDRRYDPAGQYALVMLPWEMEEGTIEPGMGVRTRGWEGEDIGAGRVVAVKQSGWQNRRALVNVEVPADQADLVAGILFRNEDGSTAVREPADPLCLPDGEDPNNSEAGSWAAEGSGESEEAAVQAGFKDDKVVICRCERVTKDEIAAKIRDGCRDINALKAELRVGMGPCGGKTCMPLIMRVFRELGVKPDDVEPHVERPFTQEVPMGAFLGEVKR
jgi:hypothetical protein